jgi:hypothetical protein
MTLNCSQVIDLKKFGERGRNRAFNRISGFGHRRQKKPPSSASRGATIDQLNRTTLHLRQARAPRATTHLNPQAACASLVHRSLSGPCTRIASCVHCWQFALVGFNFRKSVLLTNLIRSTTAHDTEPFLRIRIPSDFLMFHRNADDLDRRISSPCRARYLLHHAS